MIEWQSILVSFVSHDSIQMNNIARMYKKYQCTGKILYSYDNIYLLYYWTYISLDYYMTCLMKDLVLDGRSASQDSECFPQHSVTWLVFAAPYATSLLCPLLAHYLGCGNLFCFRSFKMAWFIHLNVFKTNHTWPNMVKSQSFWLWLGHYKYQV